MSRHDAIETRAHRGLQVSLYHDADCSSPRENGEAATEAADAIADARIKRADALTDAQRSEN